MYLILIGVTAFLLFLLLIYATQVALRVFSRSDIPISLVVADIKAGKVQRLSLDENSGIVTVTYFRGAQPQEATAVKEEGPLANYLHDNGVPVDKLPAITVHRTLTLADYLTLLSILLGLCFVALLIVAVTLARRSQA